jgi:hypothetical protein
MMEDGVNTRERIPGKKEKVINNGPVTEAYNLHILRIEL